MSISESIRNWSWLLWAAGYGCETVMKGITHGMKSEAGGHWPAALQRVMIECRNLFQLHDFMILLIQGWYDKGILSSDFLHSGLKTVLNQSRKRTVSYVTVPGNKPFCRKEQRNGRRVFLHPADGTLSTAYVEAELREEGSLSHDSLTGRWWGVEARGLTNRCLCRPF